MKSMIITALLILVLTACGGNATSQSAPVPTVDVGSLTTGNFEATVGGAVNGTFSGPGNYIQAENGGYLVNVSGLEGLIGATIAIILPEGTTPGVYTPKSYFDAFDSSANKINSVGISFSNISADGNSIDVYSTVSEGSLTLQTLDPMTGSFSFKAALESGGSVEVKGTFNQLALLADG